MKRSEAPTTGEILHDVEVPAAKAARPTGLGENGALKSTRKAVVALSKATDTAAIDSSWQAGGTWNALDMLTQTDLSMPFCVRKSCQRLHGQQWVQPRQVVPLAVIQHLFKRFRAYLTQPLLILLVDETRGYSLLSGSHL